MSFIATGFARDAGRRALVVTSCLLLGSLLASPAHADNPRYEAYFSSVCEGALTANNELANACNGALAAGAVIGNILAGPSEDSLNPDQLLANNENGVQRGNRRGQRVQSRLELRRDSLARSQGLGGEYSALPDLPPLGVIMAGRGSWYDYKDRDEELGYDGTTWSALFGADYRVSDWLVLGVLFAYDRDDADFNGEDDDVGFTPGSDGGDFDADSYSWNLFGTLQHPTGLYVDFTAGGGFANFDFSRTATFLESTRTTPSVTGTSKGDSDGWHVTGGGTVGYEWRDGALTVSPYSRVIYTYQEIDSYRESSSAAPGFSIRVDDSDDESLTTAFGFRASYAISLPFGVLLPQIRFEYEREWERDAQRIDTVLEQDPNGNVFTVKGIAPDRDYANAGFGLVAILPHGIQPYVDYVGVLDNSDFQRHTLTFGARIEVPAIFEAFGDG